MDESQQPRAIQAWVGGDKVERSVRAGRHLVQSGRVIAKYGGGKVGSRMLTKVAGKAALPLAVVDFALSVRDAVEAHQKLTVATELANRAEIALATDLARIGAEQGKIGREIERIEAGLERFRGVVATQASARQAMFEGLQGMQGQLDQLRSLGAESADIARLECASDDLRDVLLGVMGEVSNKDAG